MRFVRVETVDARVANVKKELENVFAPEKFFLFCRRAEFIWKNVMKWNWKIFITVGYIILVDSYDIRLEWSPALKKTEIEKVFDFSERLGSKDKVYKCKNELFHR